MKKDQTELLNLYSEYLLSSFGATTATGLSSLLASLLDGRISHDAVSRMLSSERKTGKDLWLRIKSLVRDIEHKDGVLIIDDSIEEKPYTDENDLICWHYDHCTGQNIKGINFLTAFYRTELGNLPIGYELVEKTLRFTDPKTGKEKRKSPLTKNEHCRNLLEHATKNRVPFRYVLTDVWYGSSENICFIKEKLTKDVITPLKSNRKVALSDDDKRQGRYTHIDTLDYQKTPLRTVYLEGVEFPLLLIRQVFTNEDNSTGILYLITTDISMTYDQITATYQKRWSVEVYHKSLKQNVSLSKSPTQTVTTQANHFFAALCGYTKLELLSVSKKLNHTALKSKLYLSALKSAFEELSKLRPVNLQTLLA